MPNLLQSAVDLCAALRSRQVSAHELLLATLAAIERINPALNAVVETDMDGALRAADLADARIAKGEARPLEGLPMTIKDSFEVVGMAATAGTAALKDYMPREDARAVAHLREAGAILIGKTNAPVLAADLQTYNSLFGTTNNPWNLAFSPGGSSGGAAAAVAAGLTALELGSDLAGSIRWPAHCCGIFGLRTTAGSISMEGHIPPWPNQRQSFGPELTAAGPLARSTVDLDLALDIFAGPFPDLFPPARKTEPKSLRVALWLDEPFARTEADVAAAVLRAGRLLEAEGAIVDTKARPSFSFIEAWEVFAVLAHAVIGQSVPEETRARLIKATPPGRGGLSHQVLQARGMALGAAEFAEMEARRWRLQREWARFFESFDVVLCPPATIGPIRHDHSADIFARTIMVDRRPRPYLDLMLWAGLAGGSGLPAAVVPMGLGKDRLPRGVEIIAAARQDRTAIAVARILEALGTGFEPPPILNNS